MDSHKRGSSSKLVGVHHGGGGLWNRPINDVNLSPIELGCWLVGCCCMSLSLIYSAMLQSEHSKRKNDICLRPINTENQWRVSSLAEKSDVYFIEPARHITWDTITIASSFIVDEWRSCKRKHKTLLDKCLFFSLYVSVYRLNKITRKWKPSMQLLLFIQVLSLHSTEPCDPIKTIPSRTRKR